VSKPPVILIDVMNSVFRQHYTHRNLTSDGRSTGLLYGFIKAVHDLRENVSKRIVFCWDHGVPVPGAARPRNWREEFLPEYKATRKHDGDDWAQIVQQLPKLHDAIRMLGYSNVAVMGLEADDVIGVLSHQLSKNNDVLIHSTDHDMYQLLSPRVQILAPGSDKGKFRRITAADVEREYEIPVSRWAEYLALGGDSSDNIKPKKGMGPKTAIKLIRGGADLRWAWEQQPEGFRVRHFDYEPIWPQILKSHRAASIPTSWSDPRIKGALGTWKDILPCPDPRWEDKQAASENFARFCANHDMTTLLAIRRNLFQTQGEQTCQQTTASPEKAKAPAPNLPRRGPLRKSILDL
jgi:5'-3' exonuclease